MKIKVGDIVVRKEGVKSINCHMPHMRSARVVRVARNDIIVEWPNGYLGIFDKGDIESVREASND